MSRIIFRHLKDLKLLYERERERERQRERERERQRERETGADHGTSTTSSQ